MTKNYDSVHVMAAKLGLAQRSDSPGFHPEAIRLAAWQRDALAEVLRELDECAAYWSEYDVPVGIHDRIKAALALIT